MTLTLRHLQAGDEAAFQRAVEEFNAAGDHDYSFELGREMVDSFKDYVEMLAAWSRGEYLPEKWVPCSYLVGALDNGELVGRVSVRHQLTPWLRRVGGHIGYMVVPRFRRQGFGTRMLAEALPFARSAGIDRCLVTCDESNIASRKIIEANGGVYRDTCRSPELAEPKLRFWIDNAAPAGDASDN